MIFRDELSALDHVQTDRAPGFLSLLLYLFDLVFVDLLSSPTCPLRSGGGVEGGVVL